MPPCISLSFLQPGRDISLKYRVGDFKFLGSLQILPGLPLLPPLNGGVPVRGVLVTDPVLQVVANKAHHDSCRHHYVGHVVSDIGGYDWPHTCLALSSLVEVNQAIL